MSLSNAVVIILGGSSGIGLATAKAARDEGAKVIVTGRSIEHLEAARDALGPSARAIALDVARGHWDEVPEKREAQK
jgi:NADP-dependent 3-hydroxy acid dehydrogenase YdfG